MKIWLQQCHREHISITDAAIREKAKSLVPELVLLGTFKASAGWIDNFKRRNGIRQGKYVGGGTALLDRIATGLRGHSVVENEVNDEGPLPITTFSGEVDNVGVSRSLLIPQEAADGMSVANGDFQTVLEHEADGVIVTPAEPPLQPQQDPSITVDPLVMGSDDNTPVEEAEHHHALVNDEADRVQIVVESLTTQEDYDEEVDPYGGHRPTEGLIMERKLDEVIVWILGEEILLAAEEALLQRIKNILIDYNTHGFIDRTRYNEPIGRD